MKTKLSNKNNIKKKIENYRLNEISFNNLVIKK